MYLTDIVKSSVLVRWRADWKEVYVQKSLRSVTRDSPKLPSLREFEKEGRGNSRQKMNEKGGN